MKEKEFNVIEKVLLQEAISDFLRKQKEINKQKKMIGEEPLMSNEMWKNISITTLEKIDNYSTELANKNVPLLKSSLYELAYYMEPGGVYVGEYKDNLLHGKGTYTLANGSKYEGEWENDKRHGKGTYTLANGDKYEGEWKDDLPHGQGKITNFAGETRLGLFENGECIGEE
ncbi:hypothetical protein OAJ56_01405 [Flavobacteriales bacterium]|nr:hypothetical protein [Flavobacteriales bacterium]MDC0201878.1 hypothetical protein [Flavobacteriales bacterium]